MLVYVAVAFLCFLAVYPMYYVLIMSLSSPENAAQMNVYVIPKGFCVDAYKVLVQDPEMWRAYLNTCLLYTSAFCEHNNTECTSRADR